MPTDEKVPLARLRDIAATYSGSIRAAALELTDIREAEIERDQRRKAVAYPESYDPFALMFEPREC